MNTNAAKKLRKISNLVASDDPSFYTKLKVGWSRLSHKAKGKLKAGLRQGIESQVYAGSFIVRLRKLVEL